MSYSDIIFPKDTLFLVTGGAGFVGSNLCEVVLKLGGREYLIDIYYGLTKALGIKREPNFGPDRPGNIKHSNADISKARRRLGYDPSWSFERGTAAAIEWYKADLSGKHE